MYERIWLCLFLHPPKPSVRICIMYSEHLRLHVFLELAARVMFVDVSTSCVTLIVNVSSCLRLQAAGVNHGEHAALDGRVHLCNSSCSSISLWQSHRCRRRTTGLCAGGEARAAGAFMLTAVFIYSLTGGLLLGSVSEDRFHLFPSPEDLR